MYRETFRIIFFLLISPQKVINRIEGALHIIVTVLPGL